jgi:ubiquinone/menaquinone biosynthesis C-methylase UbiE
MRRVWGLGDYSTVSHMLEPAAREVADACAVSAGQEVLDVAAGDGNFAVAAASEGAAVVATDLSPRMVERGRRRAEAEGLHIDWQEADAEDLPFEDSRFDCAGSVFGAFLAPRPEVASRELFRVVRPGGTVGMATWAPEGYQAGLFELNNRYFPRAEGVPPAIDWGREEVVRERFEGLAASVELAPRSLEFAFGSGDEMGEALSRIPTVVAAREALSDEGFAEYRGELAALVERFNEARDGSVRLTCPYVVIVARKRG